MKCSVEDCDKEMTYKLSLLCQKHYIRNHKYGSVHVVNKSGNRLGSRRRQRSTKYQAVHARVSARLGKASEYPCIDCGDNAKEWSYNGFDPNPIFADLNYKGNPIRAKYSADEKFYEPRCKPCHVRFDKKVDA